MINKWLTNKIVSYFRNKAIGEINADPEKVAKVHFAPIKDLLPIAGELRKLYWVGSYDCNVDFTSYLKKAAPLQRSTFINMPFNKNTEDGDFVDIFLGEDDKGVWFIAFFVDKDNLNKNPALLNFFEVEVADLDDVGSPVLTRIF